MRTVREVINDEYGLSIEQTEKMGEYDTFLFKNERYMIVPVEQRTGEEVNELYQMGMYLHAKGDLSVASFVQTKTGTIIAYHQDRPFVVLRIYPHIYTRTIPIGKELAKMHEQGRHFPAYIAHCKRIGRWKELWGQRLDQMEDFWREKVKVPRETEFEQLFIESFPYYMGLTENAIQYITDTELDEQPYFVDSATICHERIAHTLWAEGREVKLPTDWVYDHCARDLAEWVRALYMKEGRSDDEQIRRFFREYERLTPLSAFAWRLIYARLVFPLHYFECIEGYYSANKEEERHGREQMLRTILANTRNYEQFLATFYDRLELVRRFRLPTIKWLSPA
ncbi:spore coat protein YutH [Anoxybacillus rupiensis]|uniref:Spore coat protein YutH n=1 Tax=Anoxybacteroides rupiense TaxID=311460 RepID=A0ABD5IXY2_9BACL|nr:spore coat protein YutH [Anoxybacillus rupiensis]